MNNATQLKVMAYLDNELAPAEARQVAAIISESNDARSLYNELKDTRELVRENELTAALKEPQDFYWSQIQRKIEAAEKVTPQRAPTPWWMRLLAPVAGAVALFAVLLSIQGPAPIVPKVQTKISAVHEIENNPAFSTITFRSESEGVTVVWVSSKETTPEIVDDVE